MSESDEGNSLLSNQKRPLNKRMKLSDHANKLQTQAVEETKFRPSEGPIATEKPSIADKALKVTLSASKTSIL